MLTLRDLARAYLWPQRARVAGLTGMLLASATLQLAGPQALRAFVDRALAGHPESELVAIAVVFLAVSILGQMATVGAAWVAERAGWQATNALRADATRHALALDMPFHHAHAPGEMIERVDGDLLAVSTFFSRFVTTVAGSALILAGALVAVLIEEWRVGLPLLVLVGAAGALMALVLRRASRAAAVERQAFAEHIDVIEEQLSGLDDLRALAAADHGIRRVARTSRNYAAASRRSQRVGAMVFTTALGVVAGGTVLVVGLGAWLYRRGDMSAGTVVLLFQYVQMLRRPLEQIADQLRQAQQAAAGLTRVRQLLAEPHRLTDGDDDLPPGDLAIEFDHVEFSYGDESPVLHDLTLTVPGRHTLGLLGRTGSGKTTIGRLLARLYDPEVGTVRLGGLDVSRASARSLRNRVGVVTQEVHLFTAKVRDNVSLFDPSVPDAAVEAALRDVGLGAWLDRQPHGVHTVLAASAEVSAGEAQLIAFARVFVTDPAVVVLDEASSRLDPETATLVERAADVLLRERTAIIIAHRLETVARVDYVAVIDDGRVVEHGPREALSADPDSRFSTLLRTASSEVLA